MKDIHPILLELYQQIQEYSYYHYYVPGWQLYAWVKTYYRCLENSCESCRPILRHLKMTMNKVNLG